jgi:hypothetical protein
MPKPFKDQANPPTKISRSNRIKQSKWFSFWGGDGRLAGLLLYIWDAPPWRNLVGLLLLVGLSLVGLTIGGGLTHPMTLPAWGVVVGTGCLLAVPSLLALLCRRHPGGATKVETGWHLVYNLLWHPVQTGDGLLVEGPYCNWCKSELLVLPGRAAHHPTIVTQCPSCGATFNFEMSYPRLLEAVTYLLS